MGAAIMPYEILQCIFKELTPADLLECRKVCQRWRDAVDGLGIKFWKDLCESQFGVEICDDMLRKTCLSWPELYNSLNLWAVVSSSDVEIFDTTAQKVQQFFTLSDGVIAYPQLNNNRYPNKCIIYDSIAFFDTEVLEEIGRKYVHCVFQKISMNDNFTVVEHSKMDIESEVKTKIIEVYVKDANRSFIFGKKADSKIIQWFVCGDELFYQTSDHKLYCCTFRIVKKEIKVVTNELGSVFGTVIGVKCLSNKSINVLTDEEDIFSVSGDETRHICCLHQSYETVELLNEHGFNWSSPNIFPYLSDVCISSYVLDAACVYNNVILTGTESMIHIYYDPYSEDGELDLASKKPDKSIDLYPYRVDGVKKKSIQQIDVVESINGHKIMVLYCQRLLIIRLQYDDTKRWLEKKKREKKALKPELAKWVKFCQKCMVFAVNMILVFCAIYSCGFLLYFILRLIISFIAGPRRNPL